MGAWGKRANIRPGTVPSLNDPDVVKEFAAEGKSCTEEIPAPEDDSPSEPAVDVEGVVDGKAEVPSGIAGAEEPADEVVPTGGVTRDGEEVADVPAACQESLEASALKLLRQACYA